MTIQTVRVSRAVRLRLMALGALGATVLGPAAASADSFLDGLSAPRSYWSVFAGATRTDNATLSQGGPSDTIGNVGASIDFYKATGRLHADIDAIANYQDYFQGAYPSRVYGRLVSNASYAILPEHLTWFAADTYGQLNNDPLAPPTPGNQVNVNVFSTGPDINLPLGDATDLSIGGRYSQTDFAHSVALDVSDHVYGETLGIVHKIGQATAISLNATNSRTEYQVVGSPSYEQQELYARLQFKRARADLTIDAGEAQLKQDGSTVRSPLVRLTAFRQLNPSWAIYADIGREFQNSGLAFQSALTGKQLQSGVLVAAGAPGFGNLPGNDPADVILTQDALRADYARASLDFTRARTSFDFTLGERREHYEFGGGNFDRDIFRGAARLTRKLRPNLDAHVLVSYARRTPQANQPADRTKQGELGVEWRAGSMLTVTFAYQRDDRSADVGGFAYVENRVYVGFSINGGQVPQGGVIGGRGRGGADDNGGNPP